MDLPESGDNCTSENHARWGFIEDEYKVKGERAPYIVGLTIHTYFL
jgi:hypothetical protein